MAMAPDAGVKSPHSMSLGSSPASVMARRHHLQDPALSRATHPMVLNAAFLVDEDRVPHFCEEVRALADDRPDGAVVLTGPWPPYSFATLDDT